MARNTRTDVITPAPTPEPARRLSPTARWLWRAQGADRHRRRPRRQPARPLRRAGRRALGAAAGRRLRGRRRRDPGAALVALALRGPRRGDRPPPRHGHVTRTLIPMLRVQHVDTTRGPLDQLLGLATVVVHTAAGHDDDPRPRRRRTPGGCATRSRRSPGPPMSSERAAAPGRDRGARARRAARGGAPDRGPARLLDRGPRARHRCAAARRALPGDRRRDRHADRLHALAQHDATASTSTASTGKTRHRQHEGDHGPAQPHPGPRHRGRARCSACSASSRCTSSRPAAAPRARSCSRPSARRRSSGSARRWARTRPAAAEAARRRR